ncbi:MAG: hypothetical protein FWG48_02355 [Oscillospiraceae bacterium]|nr:hypothetical protein [Oscillospiraceae bacterium]
MDYLACALGLAVEFPGGDPGGPGGFLGGFLGGGELVMSLFFRLEQMQSTGG